MKFAMNQFYYIVNNDDKFHKEPLADCRDSWSESVIPRYVKSQINEQVYLPLATVYSLRLRLSNNTKCSPLKVVSTVVQRLVCQFAEIIILGYQWYVWWWQRQAWKCSGNTPNVSYRLGVTLFIGLPCPGSVFYDPRLWESLSQTNWCGLMEVTKVGKCNDVPSGSKAI